MHAKKLLIATTSNSRRLGARLGAARQFYFWPRSASPRREARGRDFIFLRFGGLGAAGVLSLGGRFFASKLLSQELCCSACCWSHRPVQRGAEGNSFVQYPRCVCTVS